MSLLSGSITKYVGCCVAVANSAIPLGKFSGEGLREARMN